KRKLKKAISISIKVFLILFVIVFGSFYYMRFVGTSGLVVREYRVVNPNLPSSFHGLKVVHLSDFHYNSTFDERDLKVLVKKVNRLKPDIIVFTGDLTDKDSEISESDLKVLVEQFNKMEATLGMYAVRGNHDYETSNFDVVFTKTTFKILDNNYDLIYSKGTTPILLTGFGSNLKKDFDVEQAFALPDSNQYFTIAILHEPDAISNILESHNVNLALSGHSHNGQIRIPGIGAIYSVNGSKKYPNEHYKIGETELFVSGGLGTSGSKLRLFNRPSINFYRLVEK
ncbi:MAG: metallophosphoesterase, partial [Bacilli bacterium]|nr:metallophosphoesterase [Bacilli bacterium]